MIFQDHARWIWLNDNRSPVNQYVQFRRGFSLASRPKRAILKLAVDTQYALFVNGHEITGRAFSDYPHYRSVDRHDITSYLKSGSNCLAILGFFFGVSNSEYRAGQPGLIVQLDMDHRSIVSDRQWKTRLAPDFKSGHPEPVTPQMGFIVNCDARKSDAWTSIRYRPGAAWTNATELAGPTDGYHHHVEYRRQRQLEQGPCHLGRPIAEGDIMRPPPASDDSPALTFVADFKRAFYPLREPSYPIPVPLPKQPANGRMVLVDLGEESFGLFHMEIKAGKGTQVDIAHGEHIDDLGVRSVAASRHFVDRYICQEGMNRFTLPFRRLGCRYLELHFLDMEKPVTIHKLGLLPVSYPVQETGAYHSPDHLMQQIRSAAIHTLKRCMADHYMDCPWREQSLYAYDSRNQALYGYYAFGEYTYPLQSFRLLGWGERPDGLLELCAPARTRACIPIFTLVWISAVRDHFLFSGQSTLFDEFHEQIERLLQTYLKRKDAATGLYGIFDSPEYWTFYEWEEGLTSKSDDAFRLDAPHNLYLLEGLIAYADLLAFTGKSVEARQQRRKADTLRKAIHRVFWDPRRRRYASFANREKRWHYATGVQGLALSLGVCPAPLRNALQSEFLDDTTLVPVTLSALFYAWRAMQSASTEAQIGVLNQCLDWFGTMVLKGDSTLWEVIGGGPDFQLAGSLCHGWSSAPLWLQQAYILGIQPLEPGFTSFRVQPHLCGLPHASGVIPTPSGEIHVSWECYEKTFRMELKVPKGLTPSLFRPPGFRGSCAFRVNGKSVKPKATRSTRV